MSVFEKEEKRRSFYSVLRSLCSSAPKTVARSEVPQLAFTSTFTADLRNMIYSV